MFIVFTYKDTYIFLIYIFDTLISSALTEFDYGFGWISGFNGFIGFSTKLSHIHM